MTPTEFDAALATLGLDDQTVAARALGCTPRAIRHWRTGHRRISGPVVVHLRDLLALKRLDLLELLPSMGG